MKRIVMMILAFVMMLQLSITPAYADANDYRKQFIEIKKNQTIADIDTNALSMDDLRFLALFISNFYIPWSTALDDEDELGIKEKIVKTLTETCNFDEDVAEVLVESVYKASLETAKPLYFCSDDSLGMRTVIESMDTSTNLDPYKSSGNVTAAQIIQSTGDGSVSLPDDTYRMTYGMFLSLVRNNTNVEAFWSDSNEPAYEEGKVAFGTNAHVVNAYGLYNSNLNYKNGIGSGFLTQDVDIAAEIRSEAVHQILTPVAPLYVDWVGNIIVDDGVSRIVVLPACLNPYAFKVIGGKDGARLNLISLLGFSEYSKGHIVLSKEASDKENDDIDGSKERYKTAVYNGSQSLFNLEQWRPCRGNGGTSILDSDYWVGISEGDKKLRDVIEQYFGIRALSNIIGFPNWKSRLSSENVSGEYYFTKQTSMAHVDYVWLDSLQEYEWDENEVSKYFHVTDLATETPDSSYSVSFSDITDFGGITSLAKADDATLAKIYFTYLFAYANYQTGATSFDKNKHLVNMMFNGDVFPKSHDNNIDWGSIAEKQAEKASDERSQEVVSMIYYILHPKEGMRYVSVWAKNKISAVLLGWHEDMVGATSSNTSTGMTRYIGFTGYTTIPALEDMEWTDWLLENYNSIIVYLIIIITAILCCYIIVGALTVQRAVAGMLIFAVLVFLPPVAINASVGFINWACDSIYGNKFVYWALVQHQSYLQDLYAVKSGSAEDYKDFVLGVQVGYAGSNAEDGVGEEGNASAAEQTDNNYASVRLKWISPKKDNYMAGFVEDMERLDMDNEENGEETPTVLTSNLGHGIISNKTSGQEFLDSPEALFLYRDYMNITMYSLKSYNLYSAYYGGIEKGSNRVDFENGDYKLQVGTHWTGGRDNKNITYSSGVSFQNSVYANYEVSGGIYQSPGEWEELSSLSAIRRGFLPNTLEKMTGGDVDSSMDYYTKHNMAVNYLLNYPKAYADIHTSLEELENDIENGTVTIGKDRLRGYGLPQNYFNFTQTDLSASEGEKYSKDSLDYFYYGLYSESPYYFFTFNVLDQMNAKTGYTYSDKKGTSENFKNLFLGDNLEYFYNYSPNSGDGYGEMKDFLNMHDLFYYVIPLMSEGNQLVHQFDDAFGMKLYDDIKVRFTADGYVQVTQNGKTYQLIDVVAPDGTAIVNEKVANDKEKGIKYRDLVKDWTEEKIYKFWHNYNVITIFNAYSAWVDTMYDCGYAKAETITVAGKKKVVENPLDPTCYYMTPVYARDKSGGIATDAEGNKKIDHYEYDGRPMVFSKSEMKYYGLEWNDLTQVEKKIINVAENVYEKAIDLMNYYTFDDNVLVSAYAMLQLFEFNKEFSQINPVGTSYVMYPQGYELKAFTYDAYLRLILSNTTGDNLQDEDARSLYERIMEDSSITFGILLIILDIICVYLIPAFKVFFLVVLFLLSIVMIIASAVKIELNILNVTRKSLINPLLWFCTVSIGLAFLVALFMSNGAKGVTGEISPTIKLGDPTMVTAVMIFINACALYFYWKICRQMTKDFVTYTKVVANSAGGVVSGAFKTIGGIALAGGVVSAVGSGGFGDGKAQGSYNPNQAGKNNLPQPMISGQGSGDMSPDGNAGDSDSKKYLGGNTFRQSPQQKTHQTRSGVSADKYENRIQRGKERREIRQTADYDGKDSLDKKRGIKATLEDAKRSYGDKAKTYGERADSQRDTSESVRNSNALLGEQLAGMGVGIASKKNAFLKKQYSTREKAVDIALKPVYAVDNAKKNVVDSVSNIGAVKQVRKNMTGYKAVLNKANGSTDRKINSYKKKEN